MLSVTTKLPEPPTSAMLPGELVIVTVGHKSSLMVTVAALGLPTAERRVGGLGIHFVRNLMDKVSYARRDGSNLLKLVKNVAKA